MPTRIDSTELQALGRRLARVASDAPREISRAVSSIARAGATEAKRSAAAVYALPSGRIADDIRVSQSADAVEITGRKRPPTLLAYGATRTKRGLSVRVLRGGPRTTLRRAFVVDRLRLPFGRVGADRFPIRVLYGPSVADMLNNPRVLTPMQERLILRGTSELQRRIARAISGAD